MTYENILATLSLIGVGGAVGAYFRMLWERKNTTELSKLEFKETRYKCIVILMYSVLDFKKHGEKLNEVGRNFQSKEELIDELKVEWHNAILYASDEALESLYSFIRAPSVVLFKKSVLAMRKDLWGGKLSKSLERLDFHN